MVILTIIIPRKQKSKRGKDACRSKSYPKEKLEEFIVKFTRDDILSPEILDWLSENIIQLQGQPKRRYANSFNAAAKKGC